jgi:hypothetical protein
VNVNQAAVHFSRIGVTRTSAKDFPRGKQRAFNRDVITPQDGHIFCDPYPAICGFSFLISHPVAQENREQRKIASKGYGCSTLPVKA